MKINVDSTREAGANFVDFTHVRNGENYHAFIRLQDIKSWESIAMSGKADRATRWRLTTVQGDVYYTLNNFNEIMTTTRWYPRPSDGRHTGRVGDERLYGRSQDEKTSFKEPIKWEMT